MNRPNIVVFFSDQQRFDTLGCNGQRLDITPTLDSLAAGGVNFTRAYTVQPVCGPARAMLQTGLYPTETGCFRNAVSLPPEQHTVAERLREAGYQVAYVGKWHLASDRRPEVGGANYETSAIPPERRGGYNDYWVAADILEFTSHGYGGYLFDKDGERRDFEGYRTDCVTDYALDYLDQRAPGDEAPFFLFLSHIEPHHQNDRDCFEGPNGSRERFGDFDPPADLPPGEGDWQAQMAEYLGCCRALDDNLARVVEKLKAQGLYENTVILYTTDHGCHFKTHIGDAVPGGFDDYKRSYVESVIHIPMVAHGPGFTGGREGSHIVELLDIPRTIVEVAGADSGGMRGRDLRDSLKPGEWQEEAYIQISESYVGRCLRTPRYTYCVYAPDAHPSRDAFAARYVERFLFDNEADPLQQNNLVSDPAHAALRQTLAARLSLRAEQAGEPPFDIVPSPQ